MSKKDIKMIRDFIGLSFIALGLASGLAWGSWQLVLAFSVSTLRVLVIIGAVATPAAAFVGWRLGNREATARLRGIDEISERVMGTAEKVAALRVGVHRARKQDGPVVIMPMALPPIVHRAALESGDDVVDL